jgi:hypothetical protein
MNFISEQNNILAYKMHKIPQKNWVQMKETFNFARHV